MNRKDKKRLADHLQSIKQRTGTFVGYPCTTKFDYSDLYDFLALPLNNVGDPFSSGLYDLNTREFECEVLNWFANLNHAPMDNYWGYVTNGGTEGNMYGLYLARELYPKGVVYYSQDTHYSVSKNIRMLGMEHVMIKSQSNGEIDYTDLRDMIATWRSAPPIIFANIGTTMKEGIDDIYKIHKVLKELAIPEYYVHCDAALCGMTLPFLADAPVWDFRTDVQSISISGHKFIGSPIPCGIVLALKSNVGRIARAIEYVGTLDTTVTGSRNGFTPLIMWHAIKQYGFNGFKKIVNQCRRTAEWSVREFERAGIPAWKNDHAITVVFPKPSQAIIKKWQLAHQDDSAHIICTSHVSREIVHDLIDDITG